jgi:hypothetical protein
MRSRRPQARSLARLGVIASLVAASALLTVGAAPALAAKGAVTFFGGDGTTGGKFAYPEGGLAINQTGAGGVAPGDVYVVDGGNSRVQEFSATGSFVRAFGLNVGGPGIDDCEVAASCGSGTESTAAGAVTAAKNVAVDQTTGAVYVISVGTTGIGGASLSGNNRVDVFSATGEFEGSFGWGVNASAPAAELQFCTALTGCRSGSSGSGAGQLAEQKPSGSAVDPLAVSPLTGDVLVADEGNNRINEYHPIFSGGAVTGVSFVRSFGTGVPALAIGASGTVYGAAGTGIETYDSSGASTGPFGATTPNGFKQLSINKATGEVLGVYIAENAKGATERWLGLYSSTGQLTEAIEIGDADAFGVAQNEASGTVYIGIPIRVQGSPAPNWGVVTIGQVVPPHVTIEPVGSHAGTTATFAGHVNPEGFNTTYRFEYSTDGTKWTSGEEEELPPDTVEHAVSGEASELEALTNYHVRLTANKALNSGSGSAETEFETSSAAPVVSAPTAANISDQGADLGGTVNPENESTGYRFDCVAGPQFAVNGFAEAFEVPAGGASIAAAGGPVPVSATVAGLAAFATYHCRLVASNATGSVTGNESTFTTYAGQPTTLPDGRAYEQATPLAKNASDASGAQYLTRAAPDGNAVSWFVTGGGPLGSGGQEFPTYAAARGDTGWASYAFLPPANYGELAKVIGWSHDLSTDYLLAWNSGTRATLYAQDAQAGTLEQIATGLEPYEGAVFAGEVANESAVLFESKAALAEGGVEGANNLYLWTRASNSLAWISQLPDGSAAPGGVFSGPYSWGSLEPKAGGSRAYAYTEELHSLSDDGSKAFFTTSNVDALYVREGIGTAEERTVQVSASKKTNGSGPGGRDPAGSKRAAFMEATPDGQYVFFTSPEELTNDATTGTADQGNDLYRYDVETGGLVDIAPDVTDISGANVQGVLGASVDGSTVYFAANGVLGDGTAEGANAGTCSSSPLTGWGGNGTCNIYRWHEGAITFVAPIGGSVVAGALNWVSAAVVHGAFQKEKTSRVSDDGRTLAFVSPLSPTSYESDGKDEVYLYRTGAGLDCVSCSPTGSTPVGSASLQDIEPGFLSPVGPNTFMTHNLNAEGTRMFFETPDKLVSSDTNGDEGCPKSQAGDVLACQDVYEWEADGAGSCRSQAQNGGCLYLISPGDAPDPALFADAGENGDDVFFFTRQSLVRSDTDQLVDVYDARVGGGIAAQTEPPPVRCEAEGCKNGASVAAPPRAAGTANYSGPGNPKGAQSCKKGFLRKHGNCVKKHGQKRTHGHRKQKKKEKQKTAKKRRRHQKTDPTKANQGSHQKGGH